MMYRILLAIGGDTDSIDRIVDAITSLPGESEEYEVTALNVFEEFDITDEGAQISSDELYNETAVPDAVQDIQDELTARQVSTIVRREHGDPAEEILAAAEEIGANAIAVVGRKRSPVGKAVFGSVTQEVILTADRPVLTAVEG